MDPYSDDGRLTNSRALDKETIMSGAYWGELRTFLALAKSKSINRTASMLGLSKATISRHLQRLQDLHRDALFVTSKRGVLLTAQGERLARMLLRFDQELSTFSDEVRDEAAKVSGTIRVSVTDALGLFFIAPELPGLLARHPLLRIHIKTPMNMKDLHENQTDLLVTFLEPPRSKDLVSRRLGTVHLTTMASRAYLARRGLPTRETIAGHDFVTTDRMGARGGPWEPWHALVDQGRAVHEADASLTYGLMVKLGMGIGLLTSFNVIDNASVSVDLGVHIGLPIYVTALKERLAYPHTRVVFDLVSEVLGPSNPVFAPEMRLDLKGTKIETIYALTVSPG